jgi:tetratricopeptide (TPR) repeat protein
VPLPEPEPEPEEEESVLDGLGGSPMDLEDSPSLTDDLDVSLGLSEPEPPPISRGRRPPIPEPEPEEEPVEEPAFGSDMSVEDLVGHSASPADNGDLDLGSELGGLFEAQSAVEEPAAPSGATELGDAGLAEIFKEFKAGVDRQLGKEDYDTRYNLGIAYKEMGLIDEAIAEFQLAAKDERRVLECSSMLGLCFMEKGMPKLAIKWFERGLKTPGRTPEEYLGLRYDLAAAHEATGDVDTARDMFGDLMSQNANFRDVAEKVRALGGG